MHRIKQDAGILLRAFDSRQLRRFFGLWLNHPAKGSLAILVSCGNLTRAGSPVIRVREREGRMPISDTARERLDRLMNDRRLELNLTWRDVAARAGLSYEALRSLRTGTGGVRDLTAVQIARALDWAPRSVLDILKGGDPVPAESQSQIPADAPLCTYEREILAAEGISDDTRLLLIRGHRLNEHDGCVLLAACGSG
jgi:hypothetical protein